MTIITQSCRVPTNRERRDDWCEMAIVCLCIDAAIGVVLWIVR